MLALSSNGVREGGDDRDIPLRCACIVEDKRSISCDARILRYRLRVKSLCASKGSIGVIPEQQRLPDADQVRVLWGGKLQSVSLFRIVPLRCKRQVHERQPFPSNV